MTLITPDEGPDGLNVSVTILERQLNGIIADLEVLQGKLRAEEIDAVKDSTRMMSDIRNWIRLAIEAEMKLEQRNKKEKGIVHAYALDMDAARDSVGCRLDRLRRTCCAGRLPRCPD